MLFENGTGILAWRIVRAILLFPFLVLAGLGVFLFFNLVFLPLVSLFQIVRFVVDPSFRSRMLRETSASEEELPADQAYFHRGHTWVRPKGESVAIGPDEFARSMAGRDVGKIEHAAVGTEMKSGETVWTFRLGDRRLEQVLPIAGTLLDINKKLFRDPSLLGRLAVQDLWVVKMRPSLSFDEVKNVLTLATFREWNERVKERIVARFCTVTGVVLAADGGTWLPDLGAKLNDEEWETLVAREFK